MNRIEKYKEHMKLIEANFDMKTNYVNREIIDTFKYFSNDFEFYHTNFEQVIKSIRDNEDNLARKTG